MDAVASAHCFTARGVESAQLSGHGCTGSWRSLIYPDLFLNEYSQEKMRFERYHVPLKTLLAIGKISAKYRCKFVQTLLIFDLSDRLYRPASVRCTAQVLLQSVICCTHTGRTAHCSRLSGLCFIL